MADTRGVQQDELHKESIETQIKKHIDSVTAVLILANGTVPRVTAGTDYALSTLSAIFPKSLASNTAFMFTNVLGPLHWNFSGDTIPNDLRGAPFFLLSNPVALQRKYLKLKDDPNMKKMKTDLRKAVKTGEKNALGMLVDLFDWLDGLEPQPTMEMFPLSGEPQMIAAKIANAPAPIVAANQKTNSVRLHLAYTFCLNSPSLNDPNTFSNFQKIIPTPASQQKSPSNCNYFCAVPNCYSNCFIRLSPIHVLAASLLPWLQLVQCSRCAHPYWFHVHVSRLQSQRDVSHNFTDDYAGRWPSWSLPTRVERAIRLLDRSHTDMEEKGVSREQLTSMQRSLEQMKWGLDLLRKAKEKVREGIRKVKQSLSVRRGQ